jgi:ubiquinol-cytochrome c reductase cytochrome b subunit
MLRATTDEMVNVLVVSCCLGTVLGVLKGKACKGSEGARRWWGGRRSAVMLTFDAKFWGVVVMGGAVIILFFLPWLDRSPVKSIRYRPTGTSAVRRVRRQLRVLGYLGIQPPSDIGTLVSQVGTLFYFGFFLLMPWWSRIGEFKPVPDRVTFKAH